MYSLIKEYLQLKDEYAKKVKLIQLIRYLWPREKERWSGSVDIMCNLTC